MVDKIESLFLGTPAAGSKVSCLYVDSLLKSLKPLRERGTRVEVRFADDGWTAAARNELVHGFLKSEASHLLMIDADEGWDVRDILSLLVHAEEDGVPIIGAFYPAGVTGGGAMPENPWPHHLLGGENQPGRWPESTSVKPHGTWPHHLGAPRTRIRVDWVPTGFLLIAREVFTEIRDACGDALVYFHKTRLGEMKGERYEYFRHAISTDREYLGEDVWFSRVLNKIGIPIYKLVGTNIRHEKRIVYGGFE